MSWSALIRDARGDRTRAPEDFPLAIGGPDADIALPGNPGREADAFIGLAEGHPFVQPARTAGTTTHNGRPLPVSRWLRDGDLIAVGGVRIHCRLDDERLLLHIEPAAPEMVQPPAEPPPGAANQPPRRRRGNRPVAWLLLAVFVALVLSAGFVFVATPVTIDVEPAPERVALEGALPTLRIGGRYLALPGSYTVVATRPGFQALQQPIDIPRAEHQVLHFALQKLPGILSITTRPVTGARVYIGDRDIGVTPLTGVEIPAGSHTVRLQADRYEERVVRIDVEGLGTSQTLDVELTPNWAYVSFDSQPQGAAVHIDGEPVGETPGTLELLAGTHKVAVLLADHDPVVTELTVQANQTLNLPAFTLEPTNATLSLTSVPTGATVSVDGEFRGRTPIELALPPRRAHTLQIAKAGYETSQRSVQLDAAEEDTLAVSLTPQYGVVFVASQPADALLFIDGKPAGPATQRLKLRTVSHSFEIRKTGYRTHQLTVTPRHDVSQSLSVTLARQDAPTRTTPGAATIVTSLGQVLRLIRPGPFEMGASRREQGRRANESIRRVQLSRPFYLGENEVTNAEFQRFKPAHQSTALARSSLADGRQPVVQVSWEDAARYLNWLSEKEGLAPAYTEQGGTMVPVYPPTRGYRLPTEAEWAYAARHIPGGPPLKYPWGAAFPPSGRAGNYADESARRVLAYTLSGYDDGFAVTAPVGSFPANSRGIYDLGGNVAEWCHDYYTIYTDATAEPTTDPVGPSAGEHHVVRGSSWKHATISELRLAYRDYGNEPRDDLGFRIARYAD